MQKLGASLITMDHLNFYNEINLLEKIGGVDYLHLDMMDGHFVPRYGIYPEIIEEISNHSNFELDLHLMVSDVEFAISQVASTAEFSTISFHYSTNEGNVFRIIDKIRDIGAKPVLALDLSTSLHVVHELLDSRELDGLLFMGIHPGVVKQVHRPENVIRRLNKLKNDRNWDDALIIQVDGGFNFDTASSLKKAGVNSFVGGSSSIYAGCNSTTNSQDRVSVITSNISSIRGEIGA
jgi:ribulose-phosphate 3-epimerase